MKEKKFNHNYILILRCRTFGIWPEWTSIFSNFYVVESEINAKKIEITFSMGIVCYERRPLPEIDPPRPEIKSISPIVWRGDIQTGFCLGDSFIKAPEDEVPLALKYEHAYQGEIDIFLKIGSDENVSYQILDEIFHPIARSIATYMGITLDDFILPVAPVRISKLKNGTAETLSDVIVEVKNRPDNTIEIIREKFQSFSRNIMIKSKEERIAYDVACRRYLSSFEEIDLIDRYCDLWEVCEFLTIETKAKGKKVGKIAKELANYIGASKSDVENKLEIKEIYDVRNDIVHNAIEQPEKVNKKLKILKEISRNLILSKSGEAYKGSKLIDEMLESTGNLK